MESQPQSNSIFWVEVEKIRPNPYQPRREFDEYKLADLSESIKQYGVLQPLVVTRYEIEKPDGGIAVGYELIAGERRLRASKLAGVAQVPVLIRNVEDNDRTKLELAIIENLQREDLNPIDRAIAFQRLVDEFNFKHIQVAKRVSKSREYISNTLRLLSLRDEIKQALLEGKISEGHARTLMMLNDRLAEQDTLFKEIMFKKLSVREAESIARKIAHDKVRKRTRDFSPEIMQMERNLTEKFGTRVQIEAREVGGKIMIEFDSDEDLRNILTLIDTQGEIIENVAEAMQQFGAAQQEATPEVHPEEPEHKEPLHNESHAEFHEPVEKPAEVIADFEVDMTEKAMEEPSPETPETESKKDGEDVDLYNIRNFSL